MNDIILAKQEIKEILEQHKIWITSSGMQGVNADLHNVNMFGAYLRDVDLRNVNFRGANLSNANLSGANLSFANLYGANLLGADLRGANLSNANLRYANLHNANLRGANLISTELFGANLGGANLCDTDLFNADLRSANICGTILPKSTFIIEGETYFITIANGESVRAGCQGHLIVNWRQFSKKEIVQMGGIKAVKFYPRLLDIIDFYCGKGERPDWLKNE